MKKLIGYFAQKHKTLFLIDAIGALITAFFLGVIMLQYNEYFGMPKNILFNLSIIAICLCIYSATCFLFLKNSWAVFVQIIGIANLLYCALTIGFLIKFYPLLTIIGILYFLVEIVIIFFLSYIELKVALRSKS